MPHVSIALSYEWNGLRVLASLNLVALTWYDADPPVPYIGQGGMWQTILHCVVFAFIAVALLLIHLISLLLDTAQMGLEFEITGTADSPQEIEFTVYKPTKSVRFNSANRNSQIGTITFEFKGKN